MRTGFIVAVAGLALVACTDGGEAEAQVAGFTVEEMGTFAEPWAMTFLPNDMLVVTEKAGTMRFIDFAPDTPRLGTITGLPEVDYGGQGGLGDVVAHPDFASNNLLYFSFAEAGQGDMRGAAVARGALVCEEADACRLDDVEVIWRQAPKVTGRGHYSHRIAFGPEGHLWISSGDRQKLDPAQDLSNTLGTIVRLNDDGSVPDGNPFADRGGVSAEIWSYGHRNVLGLAFAPDGSLWDIEHGPAGGDEINRVERGANYGWPEVSNGNHYDGRPIPDHDTSDAYRAPAISWTPVIAPGDFIFYTGDMFADWQGDILAAGMTANGLVRVEIDGDTAREAARYDLGERIREVEQGPDGAIWVLEDADEGRLLRLTPGQ
ncbi:MAG: PQQ-dependent sugar dehydrogenase [Sphingomonadaceae bacterium]|nr:PQQ-dependent sugar dehydrogenase [Sphingomonadaceae bacterium]